MKYDDVVRNPLSTSYHYMDVKKQIDYYCGRNMLTLKEFLAGCEIRDQSLRYWSRHGYVPVWALRKIKKRYPSINLTKVRILDDRNKPDRKSRENNTSGVSNEERHGGTE